MKKMIDWIKKNWIIVITIVAYLVFLYFAITIEQQKWPALIAGGLVAAFVLIMVAIGLVKKTKK